MPPKSTNLVAERERELCAKNIGFPEKILVFLHNFQVL